MNEPPRGSEIRLRLREALDSHPEIRFAYLFGSRAAGTPHGSSDVDVAVHLDPEIADSEVDERLREEIRGSVVRAAGTEEVDLVVLNRAPPLLADRVARTGVVLLSRSEPERIRWIVRTKSRYCDLRPLRRRLDRAVSERLRSGGYGRPASDMRRAPAKGTDSPSGD